MDIALLIQIAQEIGQTALQQQLQNVLCRRENKACELILPFVGEFSSGKTTLINALTDSKALQTATQPTTATIYDIHFGCPAANAIITRQDGTTELVEDIASLDNKLLADVPFVTINDTATKISRDTVIVDTPGLSSPDTRHKQTLANFLPKADAIILVSDINQQITRSLTDFIKTMALSQRPIYLVLTKSDTKSKADIQQSVDYIKKNNKDLPLEDIICVSAAKNDINALYALFERIQQDKSQIIAKVDEQRTKEYAKKLISIIDEMIEGTNMDKSVDNVLGEQQHKLRCMERKIENIISDAELDIEEQERKISRCFEDNIFTQLESIIMSSGCNYDQEAVSAINTTSTLMLNQFRNEVKAIIAEKIKKAKTEDFSLDAVLNLDLSGLSIEGLSYNIDLNSAGHESDKKIATGLKFAAAVGTVIVAAGAVTRAVGSKGVTALAAKADNVLDVVDSTTDVASIISNQRTSKRIEAMMGYADKANTALSNINQQNMTYGQNIGCDKGIVESIVGFITEKTMGKPQRRRAINSYLEGILMPQFKMAMQRNKDRVITILKTVINEESASVVNAIQQSVKELKAVQQSKRNEYEERIKTLKNYKKQLLKN